MSHAVREAGGIAWAHIEDGHLQVGPHNCFPPYCSSLPDFLWLSYRAAGHEIASVPFFFPSSLITAAGQTFVLQMQGGRLCINAGSEPRKRETRVVSQTEEEESVVVLGQQTQRWCHNTRHTVSHLLVVPRGASLVLNVWCHPGIIIMRLFSMISG